MTIDDKISDEKLQYDINREAAKISALSFRNFDKYNYLTGEEIISLDQRRVTEQAKFAYSPLGKAFEEETKTIEEQRKNKSKHQKSKNQRKKKRQNQLKDFLQKKIRNNEIKNQPYDIQK